LAVANDHETVKFVLTLLDRIQKRQDARRGNALLFRRAARQLPVRRFFRKAAHRPGRNQAQAGRA
jgi:hypothetical protein